MIIRERCKQSAPEFGLGIRLAIYQPQAGLSGTEAAIERSIMQLEDGVKIAKEHEAQLISFPELFLTGYAFKEANPTAWEVALTFDCPTIIRIQEIAKKYEIAIICPYPEKAEVAGKMRYYDSMVLIDKDGKLLKNYRKTQLWGPDEQKLWDFGYVYPEEGEPYTTHYVNGFPIGLLNCYEAEYSELARIHALNGAKLIVIPTAADEWAVVGGNKTVFPYPDATKLLIPAHALENIMFIAYNNFAGVGFIDEDGKDVEQVQYLGNSVICDPYGETMLNARKTEETMLIVDCIPEDYGQTHPCNTNYIKDRRPSLYSKLTNEKVDYEDYVYPNPPKAIYEGGE
jgi:predicted amidohydrolase